jgi:TLC domain
MGPDGRCSRSDLFAFQVASGVMQLYTGITGFWTWHVTRRVVTNLPNTPEGRLFGYLEEADQLNAAIFVYQTFDFFASWMVPEHATPVFLTHHVLAAFTAWMSLEFQMVHYYAIFFGGCSEISTIFLVLCDFDVYFPARHGSAWGNVILFCQVSFTLTFLYYRIVGWWQVSVQLWSDVLTVGVMRKRAIDSYRPGKAWFLYGFLAMDLALGLLQVYWFGFGIVPKIVEIFFPAEA